MAGFLLLLAIVVTGWRRKASRRSLGTTLVVLWALFTGLHLIFWGHPNALTRLIGGDPIAWLGLGAAGGVVLAYRAGLGWLRARAIEPETPQSHLAHSPGALSAGELERYARHIFLREVGGTGQRKLKAARVLVVGAGGLGSPALLYLAAAGVGTIGVIDDDTVSASNLQRQVLYRDADIGKPKVFAAEAALKALNPYSQIRPYHRRLTTEISAALLEDYDLVLDGSDNFETRHLLNVACVVLGKPLISGAIAQWEGQISLYHPAGGAPCLACVFPNVPAPGLAPSCAEAGVMGALPGIIGAMMAAEAIKEITGAGQGLRGRLVIHDALWGESRVIAVKRDPACPVCGAAH